MEADVDPYHCSKWGPKKGVVDVGDALKRAGYRIFAIWPPLHLLQSSIFSRPSTLFDTQFEVITTPRETYFT